MTATLIKRCQDPTYSRTGVVSGGECPDEGSAEPDVMGDGRDLTNLAQRRIKHGVVSDLRGRKLMEKSRFLQDP